MDNVAQGSHRELGLPVIERTRYCQQHRDSVKKKTFDQSEHDTRIWYHGTAASKAWHHGSTQLLLSTYKVSQRNFVFFSQAQCSFSHHRILCMPLETHTLNPVVRKTALSWPLVTCTTISNYWTRLSKIS